MSKDVVKLVKAVKEHHIFWYRPNSPVIEVKLSCEFSISKVSCFNSKLLLFISAAF